MTVAMASAQLGSYSQPARAAAVIRIGKDGTANTHLRLALLFTLRVDAILPCSMPSLIHVD